MKLTPVHEFALKAALWLPLSFVVWFGLAPLWVLAPTLLARKVLLGFWPGLFTALTTPDGRFNIVMPHPERVFRTLSLSWHPREWGEDSPWMRMFRNARARVG